MADYSPARCEIIKATITPYGGESVASRDISATIFAFDIDYGIAKVAMSGTIGVLDNEGMLEGFPLRGEETLDLEIKCYDLQTVRKIKAQIFRITDVEANSMTKGTTYTLHWISKVSWNANKRKIIKAYNNSTISTMVKEIFNNYIAKLLPYTTAKTDAIKLPENSSAFNINGEPERKFYLQKTDAKTSVVIPRYAPTEAIGFCLERAFSNTQSKSSSFRFFETWEGFYCVSDEWLFEKAADNGISQKNIMNYSAYVDLDPVNITEQTRSLESFSNSARIDTARDLGGGGYKNTFVEIDLLSHTVERYTYSYLEGNNKFKDSRGKPASWKTDIHTEEFAKEYFTQDNARQFLVMRDYRDVYDAKAFGGEKNFRELVSRRVMYNQHMSATQVVATTSGRLDLSPGDVIRVNIRELNHSTNQIEDNRQLSGKYLIVHVSNVCNNDLLHTNLTLFKYDWSDAGIDDRKEN
jgi:hypothetical protein